MGRRGCRCGGCTWQRGGCRGAGGHSSVQQGRTPSMATMAARAARASLVAVRVLEGAGCVRELSEASNRPQPILLEPSAGVWLALASIGTPPFPAATGQYPPPVRGHRLTRLRCCGAGWGSRSTQRVSADPRKASRVSTRVVMVLSGWTSAPSARPSGRALALRGSLPTRWARQRLALSRGARELAPADVGGRLMSKLVMPMWRRGRSPSRATTDRNEGVGPLGSSNNDRHDKEHHDTVSRGIRAARLRVVRP